MIMRGRVTLRGVAILGFVVLVYAVIIGILLENFQV